MKLVFDLFSKASGAERLQEKLNGSGEAVQAEPQRRGLNRRTTPAAPEVVPTKTLLDAARKDLRQLLEPAEPRAQRVFFKKRTAGKRK